MAKDAHPVKAKQGAAPKTPILIGSVIESTGLIPTKYGGSRARYNAAQGVRMAEHLEKTAGLVDTGPSAVPAVYLGNRRYQVGSEPAIVLEVTEDSALRSMIDNNGAANITELRRIVSNPSAVLTQIRDKYPTLAPFILMPGGPRRGGYRTTIRRV